MKRDVIRLRCLMVSHSLEVPRLGKTLPNEIVIEHSAIESREVLCRSFV
jgi:hypothetical protein